MTPEEETFNKLKEPSPIILASGAKVWFDERRNKHRENGPAYIGSGGYLAYWKHGVRHREDGPAIVCIQKSNIVCEYWINGVRLSEFTSNRKYGDK